MSSSSPETNPKLAPPGAGLPWLELKLIHIGFDFLSRRATREKSARQLALGCDRVVALARTCPAGEGTRRVLIRRLVGMEDSSRFWSVYMTLDHLRRVHLAYAGAIESLGRGEVPTHRASTIEVKPDPAADASALDGFVRSCEAIREREERIPDLHTAARYLHPFFGPLDASQWHFLAGFHMQVHHRQMELILRGLRAP